MNGRNFEYFGEDPFLAAEIAVGYIDGVQSQGRQRHHQALRRQQLASTFASHPTPVSERALREIYLPAFEAAVKKAHVGAIMDSYNLINGHTPPRITTSTWKSPSSSGDFDGVMMSDWTATHDGVAAANAGLDLEMPFGWYMNELSLVGAVKQGKVKAPVIEDKVRRLLGVAYRFGWMDKTRLDQTIPRYNLQGREAALQGAREGIVLLKNQSNLLPLDLATVEDHRRHRPRRISGGSHRGRQRPGARLFQMSAFSPASATTWPARSTFFMTAAFPPWPCWRRARVHLGARKIQHPA